MTSARSEDNELGLVDHLLPLGVMVVAMWVVEIVDRILPANLQRGGIHPRRLDGLDGILWAPFLHSDWGHLLANTAPLLILGVLILLRGLGRWFLVTAFVMLAGGAFTWLIGGSGNHIGASGIVFGYFGALIGSAVFERNMRSGALALVAIMFYGSLWLGLIPEDGISWEGHLGGLLAGLAIARALAEPRPEPVPEPPIQGDEYWLEGTPDV